MLRALAIAALCLLASPALAQEPGAASPKPPELDPRAKPWNAYGGVIYSLANRGLSFQEPETPLDPDRSLVILLGEAPDFDAVPVIEGRRLHTFVRRGGRLLIATDRYSMDRYLRYFGMEIGSGPVLVDPLRPGNARVFRGHEDCPVVTVPQELRSHPLFEGIDALTLNRSAIISAEIRRPPLLRYPFGCNFADSALLYAYPRGKGRIIVLADQSPFINSMLVHIDGQNRRFFENCVSWLSEERPPKRVLLVCDGVVEGPPKLALPPKLPDGLTGTISQLNAILDRFQRGPMWNRLIASKARDLYIMLVYGKYFTVGIGAALLAFVLLAILRRRAGPDDMPSEARELPALTALHRGLGELKRFPPPVAAGLIAGLRGYLATSWRLDSSAPQAIRARIREPGFDPALRRTIGRVLWREARLGQRAKDLSKREMRALRALLTETLIRLRRHP